MTQKGKDYKKFVQEVASQYRDNPTPAPLRYQLKFYFPDKRKRDNANYEKCLIDALQGIVFEDDTQFKITEIEKHYDPEQPRTEVKISMYKPTQEQVQLAASLAKEQLGLTKEFENPCKRCPILFYWLTEGITPDLVQRKKCEHYMTKNIEFKCPQRPRTKQDDVIIGEGLDKWL